MNELVLLELLVSVRVCLTEHRCERPDANSTLLLKLDLELCVDAVDLNVDPDSEQRHIYFFNYYYLINAHRS